MNEDRATWMIVRACFMAIVAHDVLKEIVHDLFQFVVHLK